MCAAPALAAPAEIQDVAPDDRPVTMVAFPLVWGRNISPFTLKLETWLRLARIPFDVRYETNLSKAPKGKLPFLIDGKRVIGDSSFIIEHLKRTRKIDPDGDLGPRQLAECVAMQRLFEEHLYFAMIHARWLDPEGRVGMDDGMRSVLKAPLRWAAGPIIRRRMEHVLVTQGLGRHTQREIYALAREDLAAASLFLGEQPFFMGEYPSGLDATAFGFLANILLVPIETELKRIAGEFPNLRRYCERIERALPRAAQPIATTGTYR